MAIVEEKSPKIQAPENPEEGFHPAVRLLLARMESDPEEFANDYKWEKLLDECRTFCEVKEAEALSKRYRAIRLDAVHVRIMKTLTGADRPEETEVADAFVYQNNPGYGVTGRSQSLSDAVQQMQQMKAQQEMAKQAVDMSIYGNSLGSFYNQAVGGSPRLMEDPSKMPQSLFHQLFGKK
jgi:hypothetical protein